MHLIFCRDCKGRSVSIIINVLVRCLISKINNEYFKSKNLIFLGIGLSCHYSSQLLGSLFISFLKWFTLFENVLDFLSHLFPSIASMLKNCLCRKVCIHNWNDIFSVLNCPPLLCYAKKQVALGIYDGYFIPYSWRISLPVDTNMFGTMSYHQYKIVRIWNLKPDFLRHRACLLLPIPAFQELRRFLFEVIWREGQSLCCWGISFHLKASVNLKLFL